MKQIPLLKEQVAEFEQLKINNANLLSNMAELNAENDILKHKCYRLTQELSNYVERLPEEDIQTFSSTVSCYCTLMIMLSDCVYVATGFMEATSFRNRANERRS